MTLVQHSVELVKSSQRRLNYDKLNKQITGIIARVVAGGRDKRGWRCEIANRDDWTTPKSRGSEYEYHCKFSVVCETKREREERVLKQEFDNIVKIIGIAGNSPDWRILLVDNKVVDKDERVPHPVGYAAIEIPKGWKNGFSHIYERESQIDILMSAIKAGIDSEFQNRFHCALIGDPSCGKTETLRSLKKVLGENAVMEYDATNTTQAGAIKDLDERDELPRILIVEEIEKANEDSLRWLLSVLDQRAEIRKLNFKKDIQKETRLLTLATVNDYPLFKKIMYGALASRFAYHLRFPRPDRTILKRILEREVSKIRGNMRWIPPSLDFATQQDIYDPRKVIAICLCGKDDLLRGTYQKKLLDCMPES